MHESTSRSDTVGGAERGGGSFCGFKCIFEHRKRELLDSSLESVSGRLEALQRLLLLAWSEADESRI
jgi:hypothetical protein